MVFVLPLISVHVLDERLLELPDERRQRRNGVAVRDADESGDELVPQFAMDVTSKTAGTDAERREDDAA